jgi:hypothetical protein
MIGIYFGGKWLTISEFVMRNYLSPLCGDAAWLENGFRFKKVSRDKENWKLPEATLQP